MGCVDKAVRTGSLACDLTARHLQATIGVFPPRGSLRNDAGMQRISVASQLSCRARKYFAAGSNRGQTPFNPAGAGTYLHEESWLAPDEHGIGTRLSSIKRRAPCGGALLWAEFLSCSRAHTSWCGQASYIITSQKFMLSPRCGCFLRRPLGPW